MASSLWKSIRNWWRNSQDKAAEAIRNPVVDGHYDIIDAKKQISQYESRVTKLLASNKLQDHNIEVKEQEVLKWSEIAKRAAANQAEADVRKAIAAKQAAERNLNALRSEYEKNTKLADNLVEQLNTARDKIARAEQNKTQLDTRMAGAQLRKELAEASNEFSVNTGALASLDDLERAVLEQEALADATEEMGGKSTEELVDKYSLDSNSIDDEVNRLLGKTV